MKLSVMPLYTAEIYRLDGVEVANPVGGEDFIKNSFRVETSERMGEMLTCFVGLTVFWYPRLMPFPSARLLHQLFHPWYPVLPVPHDLRAL